MIKHYIPELEPGRKVKLQELHRLGTYDPSELTADDKKLLLENLTKHREKTAVSVRANNTAAACDAQAVANNIIKEVSTY